ncbi:RIP metalloprotease RseP [Beggiatoa alba B18LD]|uniref:Zinc metalloprotease n=1 Tax=Beggiatoa alba B18LD TaxID=395493 RepID=I3CKE2_9GAMM|nr:RIP metalloprotease RseP [Beggiatoa alba]EIJ44085.1 RIP metalloprotease RseP [Beggiatoa alba B18LD]
MWLIQTIFAFIVAVVVLVTVHEFGHYWVAKRLGVKILRFSIGFGQVLWSRRIGRDNTEFALAAVPLGGYVKMLDEAEGEVPEQERHRAFNRQPLWIRAAIVSAGPLFNFLFAILVYTLIYQFGITDIKAIVGEVSPNSVAARAGLQSGDQIIAVNGTATPHWQTVLQATLPAMLDQEDSIYTVQTEGLYEKQLTVATSELSLDDIAEGQFLQHLGLTPFRIPLPAQAGQVIANSAADRAGLQEGDRILSLNGEKVADWTNWVKYVMARPNQPIVTEIERQGERHTLTLTPDNIDGVGRVGVYAPRILIPEDYLTTEYYGFFESIWKGTVKTWDVTILSLRFLGKIVLLEVSLTHISGPIGIAQYAGMSASNGIITFLTFLGVFSISLGVMNLLPIPVLDGGHLLFYFLEWVKGKPVDEETQFFFYRIGLSLLLGLMGLAIFNDLGRLL